MPNAGAYPQEPARQPLTYAEALARERAEALAARQRAANREKRGLQWSAAPEHLGGAILSPDGTRLLTLGGEATLRDSNTLEELAVLQGHDSALQASFLLGGERVLTRGQQDRTVRLWDGRSGDLIAAIDGPEWIVTSLAFSHDGSMFATGTIDGNVSVWSAVSGSIVTARSMGETAVRSLLFQPTGEQLLALDDRGMVKLFDLQSIDAIEVAQFFGIRDIGFTRDGDCILCIDVQSTLRSWDAYTGHELMTLSRVIEISNDGRTAARLGDDGTAALVDVRTGEVVRSLPEAGRWAEQGHFTDDGSLFVVLRGSLFQSFDVSGQQGVVAATSLGDLLSVEYSSDREHVLVNGVTTGYRLLDSRTGRLTDIPGKTVSVTADRQHFLVKAPNGHLALWSARGTALLDLSQAADATLFVTVQGSKLLASSPGRMYLWDLHTKALVAALTDRSLLIGHAATILSGSAVAFVIGRGGVATLDLATGKEGNSLSLPGAISTLLASPDGKYLTAEWQGPDNTVLIDAATTTIRAKLQNTPVPLQRFVLTSNGTANLWNYDGLILATLAGSPAIAHLSDQAERILTFLDDTLFVWRADSDAPAHVLHTESGTILEAAISPNGERIVTLDKDRSQLWSVDDGKLLLQIPAAEPPGRTRDFDLWYTVEFSPDSQRAFIFDGEDASLWDARRGAVMRVLNDLKPSDRYARVSSSFSPDAKRLLTVSRRPQLWDASDGGLIGELEGTPGGWSADGSRIVTVSADGRGDVWAGATAQKLFTFDLHEATLRSGNRDLPFWMSYAVNQEQLPELGGWGRVYFLPDGRLISAGFDDTLRVRRATTGALLLTHVEYQGGAWLSFTPSYHYVQGGGGDEFAQLIIGNVSCPLSCYRNVLNNEAAVTAWLSGKPQEAPVLASPPELEIMSPQHEPLRTDQRSFAIELRARDRYGIKGFEVVQDGQVLPRDVIERFITNDHNGREAKLLLQGQVPLDRTATEIEVRALNVRDVLSRIRSTRVEYAPPSSDLYLVAIGVGDYADAALKLAYPVKDVDDLIAALKQQAGILYGAVHIMRLVDREVSAASVKRVRAEFLRRARAEDSVIVLAAGHGVLTEDGEYYFLTPDATGLDPYQGVDRGTLESLVTWDKLHAQRRVLLIDSCHSGEKVKPGTRSADRNALPLFSESDVRRVMEHSGTGVYILAATAEDSLAAEKNGNGIFTRALLDGLGGACDTNRNGNVEITELISFVSRRVPEMSGGRQYPTTPLIRGGEDFVVARVRK